MRRFVGLAILPIWLAAAVPAERPAQHVLHRIRRFIATAYAQHGIMKAGVRTHEGAVAADPRVLPLGSVIRIHDAGGYSGEYTVLDTGKKVKGRHIDIFMQSRAEAVQFGRRPVFVEVLRYGGEEPQA